MAKHPAGPGYELTREEMQSPKLIEQMGINESWLVRVGAEWISLGAFLARPVQESGTAQAGSEAKAADALLAPGAPWTPGAAFALALRLIGLYLLLEVFRGVVALVSGVVTAGGLPLPLPNRLWLSALFSNGCYLAAGLYLVRGPKAIVAWVFQK